MINAKHARLKGKVSTESLVSAWFFKVLLRLSLDSEDGFRAGCRNVSR